MDEQLQQRNKRRAIRAMTFLSPALVISIVAIYLVETLPLGEWYWIKRIVIFSPYIILLLGIGICLWQLLFDVDTPFPFRTCVVLITGLTLYCLGTRYLHPCASGIPWLEYGVVLVFPWIGMICTAIPKSHFLRFSIAITLSLSSFLLAKPYVAWAHGEPTATAFIWNWIRPGLFTLIDERLNEGDTLEQVEEVLGKGRIDAINDDSEIESPNQQHYVFDPYDTGMGIILTFQDGRLKKPNFSESDSDNPDRPLE